MIKDRIKKLRKTQKLSQPAFGERLGVSRDVINNIEQGRVEPKELFIKVLCSEFDVNEKWLRNGDGEMFAPEDEGDRATKLAADIAKSDDKTREAFEILRDLEEPFLSIARDMLLSLKKHSNE